MSIDFSLLQPLGWSPFHAQSLDLDCLETARPARVIAVERERYRLDDGESSFAAEICGRFRLLTGAPTDFPTVGDWVLVANDAALITELLPRRSLVRRGMAGGRSEGQAIAANVDVLLLVTSMDGDFSPRRLERYVAVAALAGATPVVVLTKADLCPGSDGFMNEARLPGVADVIAVDALRDDVAGRLADWLSPGVTFALVGSSGVGKSTLLNNLLGSEVQSTGDTRRDGKGRHTTTGRSLHRLPSGACVIDVPGMREVALPPDAGTPAAAFADLERIADGCRFRDCTHEQEPGCAVRRAVDEGTFDAGRLESYHKLQREAVRAAERADAVLRHRKERAFGRMAREVLAVRRKLRGD